MHDTKSSGEVRLPPRATRGDPGEVGEGDRKAYSSLSPAPFRDDSLSLPPPLPSPPPPSPSSGSAKPIMKRRQNLLGTSTAHGIERDARESRDRERCVGATCRPSHPRPAGPEAAPLPGARRLLHPTRARLHHPRRGWRRRGRLGRGRRNRQSRPAGEGASGRAFPREARRPRPPCGGGGKGGAPREALGRPAGRAAGRGGFVEREESVRWVERRKRGRGEGRKKKKIKAREEEAGCVRVVLSVRVVRPDLTIALGNERRTGRVGGQAAHAGGLQQWHARRPAALPAYCRAVVCKFARRSCSAV